MHQPWLVLAGVKNAPSHMETYVFNGFYPTHPNEKMWDTTTARPARQGSGKPLVRQGSLVGNSLVWEGGEWDVLGNFG
jgi:hypothetical protein